MAVNDLADGRAASPAAVALCGLLSGFVSTYKYY
jgi:hypothetical protein